MRLLLFANTSLNPGTCPNQYHGGGWTDEFILGIKERVGNIGVVSISDIQIRTTCENDISFFYVKRRKKSIVEKVSVGLHPSLMKYEYKKWKYYIEQFQSIIDSFKPDIIQVFGSESEYGLVNYCSTKVPVVIHIQGILSTCIDAWFPPGFSVFDYIRYKNPRKIWGRVQSFFEWKRLCIREQYILKNTKYVIGRTNWDKACVSVLSPGVKYFYGGEILRSEFYVDEKRDYPEKLVIATTISNALYKGYDMILKTAQNLQRLIGDDFEWHVYGNVEPEFIEQKLKIFHEQVNVELDGVIDAFSLSKKLLCSTVYFHSSYIENLCNSACEAEILGIPVVACHVGGIDGSIKNDENGFLIPANDPYSAAYRLVQLWKNKLLNFEMGNVSKERALTRHNKEKIISDVLNIYYNILSYD